MKDNWLRGEFALIKIDNKNTQETLRTLGYQVEQLKCALTSNPPTSPTVEAEPERDPDQPILLNEVWKKINAYVQSKIDYERKRQERSKDGLFPSFSGDYASTNKREDLDKLLHELVLLQSPRADSTRPEGV